MVVMNDKVQPTTVGKQLERDEIAAKWGDFASGNHDHSKGLEQSQNVGLNKGKLFGWFASLAPKNAPKAVAEMKYWRTKDFRWW